MAAHVPTNISPTTSPITASTTGSDEPPVGIMRTIGIPGGGVIRGGDIKEGFGGTPALGLYDGA
jgi:hypothetical protein